MLCDNETYRKRGINWYDSSGNELVPDSEFCLQLRHIKCKVAHLARKQIQKKIAGPNYDASESAYQPRSFNPTNTRMAVVSRGTTYAASKEDINAWAHEDKGTQSSGDGRKAKGPVAIKNIRSNVEKGTDKNRGATYTVDKDRGRTFTVEKDRGATFTVEKDRGGTSNVDKDRGGTFTVEKDRGGTFNVDKDRGGTFTVEKDRGGTFNVDKDRGGTFTVEKDRGGTFNVDKDRGGTFTVENDSDNIFNVESDGDRNSSYVETNSDDNSFTSEQPELTPIHPMPESDYANFMLGLKMFTYWTKSISRYCTKQLKVLLVAIIIGILMWMALVYGAILGASLCTNGQLPSFQFGSSRTRATVF